MPRRASSSGVYVSELSKQDHAEANRLAELLQNPAGSAGSNELSFTVAGQVISVPPQLTALMAGALGGSIPGQHSHNHLQQD